MTNPTHPKFSDTDTDDAEGHIYIDPDADTAGRAEQSVASPGPDGDDTEGHRIAASAEGQPGPKPEGVRAQYLTDDGEDTEGHRFTAAADDDTEGHRIMAFADGGGSGEPEGLQRQQVTDDGADTEGHRYIANADDTEGHRIP